VANQNQIDTDEGTTPTEQGSQKRRPTAMVPMLIFFLFIVAIVVLGKVKM
jgi:hypothetical protein